MVKQHNQLLNFCLGVCDLGAMGAAWLLAYDIRFHRFPGYFQINERPGPRELFTNLFTALLLSLLVFVGTGLYRPRRDKSFLLELGHLLKATFMVWTLLIVTLYFTHATRFTSGMLGLFLPLAMAAILLERGTFRVLLRYIRQRGWNLRHALIVGTGRLGQSTLYRLRNNSWTGIRVAGFVDADAALPHSHIRDVPVVGTTAQLREIIEGQKIDCVFVALPAQHGEAMRSVISQLEQTHADVRIVPDFYLSRFPMNIAVGELDGMPIISLRENPFAGWPTLYKRAFDLFGSAFALGLFSMPMLVIAAAIKFTTPGPVIYRQERISFGGKPFYILKFRTMVNEAEAAEGPQFAEKNDPRCTRFGRWLRSTSLDELPQLLNVLKGDMSMVGPRPERPEMLQKIRAEIPGFPLRLKVRAGLTGWAQVNGYRGRTSFRKRLQYDLYYLNNWSPLLDFKIVFTTLYRGFRNRNAY